MSQILKASDLQAGNYRGTEALPQDLRPCPDSQGSNNLTMVAGSLTMKCLKDGH